MLALPSGVSPAVNACPACPARLAAMARLTRPHARTTLDDALPSAHLRRMDASLPSIPFDNSYARLPDGFFARVRPTPVAEPRLLLLNEPLVRDLGLDVGQLRAPGGVSTLAGNALPDGADPLAMAYAGHQFGNWVPQLGDGRAILLGEILDDAGTRRDLQLKGAGRTPFSRGGDGRAWLGPVLREYVVSEAMAALGVPTTRALAAVATGETVLRETALPGAVLTRVARSHVRVGTFQFFIARGDIDAVRALVEHVARRHYPETLEADNPPLALLEAVIAAQAELVSHWQSIGFVHGVMNTDNCSISGDTIDYGPCAFLDDYDPETVFSSIDRAGRYAYRNQPQLAQWNLANLAQCLLPLIDEDGERAIALAQAAVDAFDACHEAAWQRRFAAKLGLADTRPDDAELVRDLLDTMASGHADFTLAFRRLSDDATTARTLYDEPAAFDAWHSRWLDRVADDPRPASERAAAMQRINPAVIPRNHRVEAMIVAAVAGDLEPLDTLVSTLADPFSGDADASELTTPPEPGERVTATFCGT